MGGSWLAAFGHHAQREWSMQKAPGPGCSLDPAWALIVESGVKSFRLNVNNPADPRTMLRSPSVRIATCFASFFLVAACAPVQQLQNVAAAGGALANSVTGTGEPASLTAAELRQLQARDFETTKAGAFASVITVLLDSGYRVLSADLDSGLITAAAPTTDRLRLDPAGVARASQTPMASAYVEEQGANAVRVRIAFSSARSATGQLGSSGERAVLTQNVYASFFSRLQEEIQQRPAPANASAVPQASGEPSPASENLAAEEVEVGDPDVNDGAPEEAEPREQNVEEEP
jgi:hypothetical protein